ncbi:MAG: hypothetical protein ABIN01_13630 [Ferruginibacter sp.]
MKNPPLPVLIVAIALILGGVVGFFYHLKDFADPGEKLYTVVLVELLRILAIVSGILLLRANNSGRGLSIAWVLLHVVISVFNSMAQTITHIVVLVIVSILLFLPVSSSYFSRKSFDNLI